MGVQKKRVRSDIVVDHDFFIWNAEEKLGNRRANGEMEDDNIPGGAKTRVIPIIMNKASHLGIIKADEDLGIESLLSQDFLDFQHLVRNRITVGERGRKLMDLHYNSVFSCLIKARYFCSITSQV